MSYIYNLTDTWNAAGTTFAGIKMVVTNTASSSSSKLLDLSVSGATTGAFSVDNSGNANVSGTLAMASSFLRNRLINGETAIDQRNVGAAQTITAGAALAYTVDRWYAYCTGANVVGQRVTGAVTNTYRYQFTGAASVTAIGFAQRIEALNSADLAGNTVTLSVDLANSLLTTVTWTAYYADTTNAFGSLAVPTRTQIATGTFTVNSTVTRYSANISLPAAATTGVEIVFSVGAQTSGTWTIGNVQLESGSIATPFERRNIAQETAFCQRYFQTSGVAPGSAPGAGNCAITHQGNAGRIGITCSFQTLMRGAPTLTVYDGAGAAGVQSYYDTGWQNGGAISAQSASAQYFYVQCNVVNALIQNFNFSASAEL